MENFILMNFECSTSVAEGGNVKRVVFRCLVNLGDWDNVILS